MNAWKVVLNIGIVAVTIVVIRACLPQPSYIGNQAHTAAGETIVIMPMAGIPPAFLKALERELEEQHNTDILVTTAMGKGDEMLMPDQGQYDASYLAGLGLEIAKRIHRENSFLIVLTNEDINYPESGFRYVYSAHYGDISVVSLARINDMNFGVIPGIIAVPAMFSKMQERALKLINKAVGYGVYGYEASSNLDSVMYGPIMGPDDLDRVGTWYQQ
jgi:predicted Zn-dependent protease